MVKKTEIDLEIIKSAHGGVCVARFQGRVVFVSDAIVGEKVRVRVSEQHRANYWRAQTIEVLEPSAYRQEHIWKAASLEVDPKNRVGGAEFGHITLAYQRDIKRSIIVEALDFRLGARADAPWNTLVVEPVASEFEDGCHWRTRMRLHVDDQGRIGPYAARSHEVIEVDSFPLAVEEIDVPNLLSMKLQSLATLNVAVTHSGQVHAVPSSRKKPAPVKKIIEYANGREFALDQLGFWQVHRGAPEALCATVRELTNVHRFDSKARNLDLYSGVGLLSSVFGSFDQDVRLSAVEANATAAQYAQYNLRSWGFGRAIHASADTYIKKLAATKHSADRPALQGATVVLDPPRSGAGAQLIQLLTSLKPAQVIYVACDPIAFARDARTFVEQGYRLEVIRALDMFPHTHHVECVARFTLLNNA